MLTHYLLLAAAVVLFCVGVIGRRSGYVIGAELLGFGVFLAFWMVCMSLAPEPPPVGMALPVLVAVACVIVAIVVELGASVRPREAGPMTPGDEREEAHVEDSARLAVSGFFWAALFGLAVVAFAPYLFD